MRWIAGLLVIAAIGLAGCGLDYRLTVYNVDRDPVRILVNGKEVGRLTCTDSPLILTPTLDQGLPWEIQVIDQATAGRIGGAESLDGAEQAQTLLVRDFGLILVPPNDPVPALLVSVRPDCPGLPANALPLRLPAT